MPPLALSILGQMASAPRQPNYITPSQQGAHVMEYQDLVRKNQQAQQDAKMREDLQAAAQQANGDPEVFATLATKINPEFGVKLQGILAEQKRAASQETRATAQEQRTADQAKITGQESQIKLTNDQRAQEQTALDDQARKEDYKQWLVQHNEMPSKINEIRHMDEWKQKRALAGQPPKPPIEVNPGNTLVDPVTGKAIYSAPAAAPKEPQRAQVPGVDVPFPPEVEAQKLRIQKAEAATKAASQGSGSEDDAAAIADAIIAGDQPPVTTGLYRLAGPVRASLAKKGYDQSTALSDWNATQKHLSTLNGAQQERLRQAITFTSDSIDNIETLYQDWKKAAGISGIKLFNKASLATAKQLPGEAGAKATALEAQIADLTSELGTVYKGGNSSTDESLRLAAKNLEADWNEQTFKEAVKNIRKNLQIRSNSIRTSQPAGIANSQYSPTPQAAPAAAPAATGNRINVKRKSDGKVGTMPEGNFDPAKYERLP